MAIITSVTQDDIEKAAKALRDGYLVAFPTETVYGLGANATDEKAVSRIYSVKGRPTDHPLIIHISSINHVDKWAVEIPEYANELAKEFWPGPMTLILKRSNLAKDFVTGGQESVGLRVPDHSVALDLLNKFEKLGGLGIAAPSANRFGAVSPTTSSAVAEEIGNYMLAKDLILKGGQSLVGIESTIINCTENTPTILRPGAITLRLIEDLLGYKSIVTNKKSVIRVSGLLKSHYSPSANITLDCLSKPGEGFIAMANIPTPKGAIRLAAPESIEQYARDLYLAFRTGDRKGLKNISVIQPQGLGLAAAIRDRLQKASKRQ